METTTVCVVDETGKKVRTETVESVPEAIAGALGRAGSIERAVIEMGRISGAIRLGFKQLPDFSSHKGDLSLGRQTGGVALALYQVPES